MDTKKASSANSLPNDRQNVADELAPEPMPPDVKVIECSCALAENRVADNSKWTNIIKEPIEVAKGSEIRVLSSFVDMRGIDQEIIQFQTVGTQQDNAHNLLVQHYTTNDGYNNKTCSYDYLSNGIGETLDPGENYTPNNSFYPPLTSANSTSNCTDMEFKTIGFVIRPKNIQILTPGTNYENGTPFTIAANNDDFAGKLITNDEGGVIGLHFTKAYSGNAPPNINQLIFPYTLGSGCTVNITIATNGIIPTGNFRTGTRTDAGRGTGFRAGDNVRILTDSNGNPLGNQDDASIFQIHNVFIGNGQCNNQTHFDQGYNYERTPVYRWAQTFTLNEAYAYGGNTGERTFLSHGQEVIIEDEASHQVNDPCLSAGGIIMNKEDEFAPGIYHTKNNDDDFTIYAPVMFFDKTDQDYIFRIEPTITNDWIMDFASGNIEVITNGDTLTGNIVNIMPLGSVWQFQFEYANIATPTAQNLVDLHGQLSKFWTTPFRVKQHNPQNSPNTNSASIIIGSSYKDYVGAVSEYNFGTQRSPAGTFPANSTIDINLVFNTDEDTLGPPAENPVIIIGTDANGQFDGSYSYRADSPGKGLRRGMTFSFDQTQYPGAQERIVIKQIDQTGGWDFGSDRFAQGGFVNDDLEVNTGGNAQPVRMYLVPVGNHSEFVNASNSPDDTILENKGNRIGFRPFKNPATIGTAFPSTINSSIIQPYSIASEPDIGYTNYASNGLYRPDGDVDSNSPFFDPRNGALVNHDTDIQLQIQNNTNNLKTFSVDYNNTGTGVIVPYGTVGDANSLFYDSGNGSLEIRVHIANWNATGKGLTDLPLNTTLVMKGNVGGEIQCQTGGLSALDGTYYYIHLMAVDIEFNNQTTFFLTQATQTYLALTSNRVESYPINPTTNGNNLNAYNNTSVELTFTPDPKNNSTSLVCQWKNMTGGMAYTALQNFWNDNDPNKSTMINKPLYKNNSITTRNAYNRGGFYFLTHMTGRLSTQAGQSNDYDLSDITNNVFNQGFDFWNMAKLPNKFYQWRPDYQTPTATNLNQSFTNITKLWDYYKLYRQNSFIIEKNFCVASDISGLWTRQAHKLTGAVDMITGGEYVSAKESGILQNEFIMPVYGANNLIDGNGTYRKDFNIYPDSGGLEAGHCVGINYLTQSALWLAGDLMVNLPSDETGKKFYYVFFRTPWTTYRGYDPLKSDSSGNPDKTALTTVNQDAYKIGNANENGQTSKKALNGQTMMATTNANPPASPPLADYKGYELGTAGGVPPNGTPVRFGERGYYPIYYLDRGLKGTYPKAKISQYVGSQNLTLAFATDISTFTFQFLHSPYTSPFVDGQGGTNSVRIFFGNRKAGIFNHETLGGVVVINYARPDYPQNTFTLTEINNNPKFNGVFQYGIDPLKSVGYVGRQFLNKLGFTDSDLGIANGQIESGNTQLNYELTAYVRDITTLTDGDNGGTDYSIQSYDTEFYGTTGTDLDSSDSILAEIPAPESNAGLESYNQLEIPQVGKSNPILRKFGDFIYYPYSLNTDSNSFNTETALVRFDNASSTYGAIGGMLLSNSNRGMGLPNTVGSTFICDEATIPRTLNPDCELYLAYTVACSSSLKQASLLPVKLTNAYLLILSSLMKEANVYMPSAGFVNAMSIVNKTFLQGDFILSQGQMSFYAKESFILSQIETEIKDTVFGSPSTLGVNSSVIYQITNYNPQPKRQLPTIEQMQDQDYEIMRLMNSHLAYLNGQQQTSPLNALQGDLYQIGVQLIHPNKNSVDIISAIRNQINAHDLANLTPAERTQFLRTDEGQILLQNVGDIQVINQALGNVAEARNDVDGEYGGILGEQRLEAISRSAEREVKAREQAIKERTPLIYFQPSEPVGQQIPPVRGLEDLNINEITPQAFRAAVPYRFASYLDYKEDAMRRLKNPKSFLEYQQFQFGNVIQPNRPVRDIDPEFFADLRKIEGPDGEENYNLAIQAMDPDTLREAQRNPFYSAYEQKPLYSRGEVGSDQYDREVEAFRDEVLRGTADLTPLQREILGDQARPLHEAVGSERQLTIDKYRRAYPKNKELIANRVVFRSEEERDEAEKTIQEFNSRSTALSPGKGRPSKSIVEQRNELQRQKQAYIDTLVKGATIGANPDIYRIRTSQQQNLYAGLAKSLDREERRRAQNQLARERADEGIEQTRAGRGGRPPEADVRARQQMYKQLAGARELAMVQEAEEEKLRQTVPL